jgi:hypothetical protein
MSSLFLDGFKHLCDAIFMFQAHLCYIFYVSNNWLIVHGVEYLG